MGMAAKTELVAKSKVIKRIKGPPISYKRHVEHYLEGLQSKPYIVHKNQNSRLFRMIWWRDEIVPPKD